MTIEVSPTIACNLRCSYCYQNEMRDAGNLGVGRIQLDSVMKTIKMLNVGAKNPGFTVFGGEALILPKLTLERLWGFGLQEYGHNNIQTNGEKIDEEFIKLFVKYNVSVGLSIDGPWPLNKARSSEEGTKKSLWAIEELAKIGRKVGLHIVLSKANCGEEVFSTFVSWLYEIYPKVSEIRLHNLELDSRAGEVALSLDEHRDIFGKLARLNIDMQPFTDMKKLLHEDFNDVSCTWNGCDPYTTMAVQAIDGDGTLTNCGRVHKDGVAYRKGTTPGNQRSLMLHETPQEHGGCKGCKYFFACGGQCPGEGIDGDWRNRSVYCQSYYHVFEILDDVKTDRTRLESRFLADDFDVAHQDTHGDKHTDIAHIDRTVMHVPVVQK